MLIINGDIAIVYENVCMFYIENYTNSLVYEAPDKEKPVSLCANMNNNRAVDLKRYKTVEEARADIECIGCASKNLSVYHL